MPRRTIDAEASIAGVGLHTGANTRLTCRPGQAGQGIVFRRTDLPGSPEVPASLDTVRETERRTGLGSGAAIVQTIEHLLAATFALELDDLRLDLDGPEPPILDGSFQPFLALLAGAGVRHLPGTPTTIRPAGPIELAEGGARYRVVPAPNLRLSVTIEWPHPLIGRQAGDWVITPAVFATELAAARTFGFASEVAELRRQGLLKGGSTDSAVVLTEDGMVGTSLRWPDEFLRHKTGDLIGDLTLLGGRLQAHITAERPSHRGNVALARAIRQSTVLSGGSMLDIARIMEVLPHRYPILLVDRILELDPGKRVVGLKNVTINEPFFQGHFPGHPIMPGVLIVEAMAQAGGMLLMDQLTANKVVYFMALDRVKFRRPVKPGDQLHLEVKVQQIRGNTCRMAGVAKVDGKVVAEGEMLACVMDR